MPINNPPPHEPREVSIDDIFPLSRIQEMRQNIMPALKEKLPIGLAARLANPLSNKGQWEAGKAVTIDPVVQSAKNVSQATKTVLQGGEYIPGSFVMDVATLFPISGLMGVEGKIALAANAPKAAPYFSMLHQAIEKSPLTKAPAEQWLGTIKNTPGVKAEELEWTGFEDWLKAQKGPVTKEQASQFLRENQVDVQEVVKGDPKQRPWRVKEHGNGFLAISEDGMSAVGPFNSRARAEHVAAHRSKNDAYTDTKFSQYQLPGGENYRELLLTLPKREPIKSQWTEAKSARLDELEALSDRGVIDDAMDAERQALINEELTAMRPGEAGTPADVGGFGRGSEIDQTFRSSHFDEPNVLAHVRFNDRVDASGKKTLFIEEIQSDWHQKGRKQGYVKPLPPDAEALAAERDKLAEETSHLRGGMDNPEYSSRMERITEINNQLGQPYGDNRVPNAPFKTAWPELALKRMIKWAADHGYDQIAWTPGKVQAERYDLSKQIDGIAVREQRPSIAKPGERDFELILYPKNGSETHTVRASSSNLDEYVGKELAERILNNKNVQPGKHILYEGLDLQVGGEGMKAFYDKMLVAAANKLGKKYGAKVGVTEINLPEINAKETQSGRDYFEAAGTSVTNPRHDIQFGEPLPANVDPVEYWMQFGVPRETVEDALRRFDSDATAMKGEQIWSLPITDAMRGEVKSKGMALFSNSKEAALVPATAAALQAAQTSRHAVATPEQQNEFARRYGSELVITPKLKGSGKKSGQK